MVPNKGLIFKSVPSGWPVPGHDLAIETREIDLSAPAPANGIITKNYYFSFDPYQRGRMRAPGSKSYLPPFTLGQPITNAGIGKVLKSNDEKFKEGDLVIGTMGIEEYSVTESPSRFRKLENPYNLDPIIYLGALGMPGLTAYSSLYEIGQPQKGETIFISAASGAVGQLVGQLAKREGMRVIGSVGSHEKLEFIKKDLGFNDGFNYKKTKASEALKEMAPNGVDIYYENVGGEQLDAALVAMNNHGRIGMYLFAPSTCMPFHSLLTNVVACGMVSQYNLPPSSLYGVKNLMQIVAKRLTMRGFIVGDANMGPKYTVDHQKNVAKWIANGELKTTESVTEGIDNGIEGFLGMLKGENFGKAVLKIRDLEKVS